MLADNVLFTLSLPQKDSVNRYDAYQDIKENLIETGVKVIPYQDENKDKILDFALS